MVFHEILAKSQKPLVNFFKPLINFFLTSDLFSLITDLNHWFLGPVFSHGRAKYHHQCKIDWCCAAGSSRCFDLLEAKQEEFKETFKCGEENAIEINNDCCTSLAASCWMEKTKTGGREIEGGNWQWHWCVMLCTHTYTTQPTSWTWPPMFSNLSKKTWWIGICHPLLSSL